MGKERSFIMKKRVIHKIPPSRGLIRERYASFFQSLNAYMEEYKKSMYLASDDVKNEIKNQAVPPVP